MVVMACAPRPAERLPDPVPHRKPQPPSQADDWPVRVARPDLPDVAALIPDLTEQLRWPLSVMEHPALEPRYPVARDLAVAGITWTELCARGVQNRRDPAHADELAYLGAWCLAEQHDTAGAVHALAPLTHSNNLGLANAVTFDLANVLVADVDFSHADELLSHEDLRDPLLWDLLAAAYFEIGNNVDSYQASSTAAQLDPNARMDVRCHRVTRLAMLGSVGQKSVFLDELAVAAKQKLPDPTCVDLALVVPCAVNPGDRCEPYFKKQNFVPWRAEILAVYEHWPERGGWSTWVDYAWKARHTWPAPGSVELINAALEAAVGAASCRTRPMHDVFLSADAISTGVAELRPKAQWVYTLLADPRACIEFHNHWVLSHR
jgi:hypothetical protein